MTGKESDLMYARLPRRQGPLPEQTAETNRRLPDPAIGPVAHRHGTGDAAAAHLAALQRSAGNAAVARTLSRTPVQRYAGPAEERDVADTASYDRISQNGKIAVSGRQEAYADAALIDEANGALAALDRVRIRLEAGREVRIDGRMLRRVLPVFATREAAEEARTNPDHEPIAGEDAQTRQNKLASYRQSVVEPPAALGRLLEDVTRLLNARSPDKRAVGEVHQRLLRLALDALGADWAAGNVPVDPTRDTTEYLKTAGKVIGEIVVKYADSRQPESAIRDLLITMPNDCQAGAQRLLGIAGGDLQQARPDPAIGENHYVNLSDMNGRWNNHFAAVIMRDGDDSLTFETAADSTSPIGEGKSLGYFALYGRHGTDQSFGADLRRQNAGGGG